MRNVSLKGLLMGIFLLTVSYVLTGCSAVIEKKVDVNAAKSYDLAEKSLDDIPPGLYIKEKDLLYLPYEGHEVQLGSVDLSSYLMRQNGRYIWYTTQLSNVPVFDEDGLIIYKSNKDIPDHFTLESFEKLGDTIGVRGIVLNKNGQYVISSTDSNYLKEGSSAERVLTPYLDQGRIILQTINDIEITPAMISKAGAITGLEKDKLYRLGFYVGTKYYEADVRADVTIFSSKKFSYLTDYEGTKLGYMVVRLPDLLEPGLYNLDGLGTFWYKGLTAAEVVTEAESFTLPETLETSEIETTEAETLPVGEYIDEPEVTSVDEESLDAAEDELSESASF